jgi:hypothetical protein
LLTQTRTKGGTEFAAWVIEAWTECLYEWDGVDSVFQFMNNETTLLVDGKAI